MDLSKLARRPKATEYVGTRVDEDTKKWIDSVCKKHNITVSSLLTELILDLRTRTQEPEPPPSNPARALVSRRPRQQ